MSLTDYLHFDATSWQLQSDTGDALTWFSDKNDVLSLNLYRGPPGFPRGPESVDELRAHFRDSAATQHGGLVSVDWLTIRGVGAVRCLTKFPRRQGRRGFVFVGLLLFPFAHCTYGVTLRCEERGSTGAREAVLLALTHPGEVSPDREEFWQGFAQDPYDPHFQGPFLRFATDDEKYDEQFPNHALSRLRRYLADIERTVVFSGDLLQGTPWPARFLPRSGLLVRDGTLCRKTPQGEVVVLHALTDIKEIAIVRQVNRPALVLLSCLVAAGLFLANELPNADARLTVWALLFLGGVKGLTWLRTSWLQIDVPSETREYRLLDPLPECTQFVDLVRVTTAAARTK